MHVAYVQCTLYVCTHCTVPSEIKRIWSEERRRLKSFLKVLSSVMDPAEIRFIRKAFLKERGAEISRKIRPSPILWKPFKDSRSLRTAVGNSELNSKRGNEIHRAVGIGSTCVGFFKGRTVFEKPPVFCTGPNFTTGIIIARLPTLRSIHSSDACRKKQHSNCKSFFASLATGSKFVHSDVANSCIW